MPVHEWLILDCIVSSQMSRSQVALLGSTVKEEHAIKTDLFVHTTSHSRNIFQMIAKNQVSKEVSRPIPSGVWGVWLRGSPGPHPGGGGWGVWLGVSRPMPRGRLRGQGGGISRPTPGARLRGLQANTQGCPDPYPEGASPGPHLRGVQAQTQGVCVYPSMHWGRPPTSRWLLLPTGMHSCWELILLSLNTLCLILLFCLILSFSHRSPKFFRNYC